MSFTLSFARNSVFILTLLCFGFFGVAQTGNFKNFNTNHGLASVEVYDIYQDVNGLLWFATDRGICSYDGYSFKTLDMDDGLPCNTVFRFYPQNDGNIWCSTMNNRIFYFSPEDYKIHLYKHNDLLSEHSAGWICDDLYLTKDDDLALSFVYRLGKMLISSKGELNISNGSMANKLNWYSVVECMPDGKWFSYEDSIISTGYFSKDVCHTKIFQPEKGAGTYRKARRVDDIILQSSGKTVYYYKDKKLIKKINMPNIVYGFGKFDEHHLWISSRKNGLSLYNLEGELVETKFPGRSISRVIKDHEGGVWISTLSSGVFYTPNIFFEHYALESPNPVYSMTRDANESLILALNNGNIYYGNKDSIKLRHRSNSEFQTIVEYSNTLGTLIYNEKYSLVNSKKYPFLNNSTVFACSSEEGSPFFIQAGYMVGKFDDQWERHKVDQFFRDVAKFRNKIYLSSRRGLYWYDRTLEKEVKIDHPFLNDRIPRIATFKNDMLLVATHNNGLVLYRDNNIRAITKEDGLTGNFVNEIYVQNDSVVWACTSSGLNRIEFDINGKYYITPITRAHGLIDNDVMDIEIIGNIVWVGTRQGLCSFPLSVLNKNIPNGFHHLRMLKMLINGNIIEDFLELDYTQNRIEFNFQGISFKAEGNLQYRYQLIGLEDKWNYSTDLFASYKSLPPGKYTFLVQAGVSGDWSDEKLMKTFTIHPPFYKTYFFIISMIVLTALIFWLFFRFRILSYNRDILRELLRTDVEAHKKERRSFHCACKRQGYSYQF